MLYTWKVSLQDPWKVSLQDPWRETLDIDFKNFQSHLGNTLPLPALYSIKITFEFVVISIVKDKQDKVEITIPDECFLQKVETVFEGGRQGLEMKGWIRLAANKLVSPSLFPVSGSWSQTATPPLSKAEGNWVMHQVTLLQAGNIHTPTLQY